MGRGRFIVLEGIDGSGSTTQARLLTAELNARGHSALLTAEPSTGPIGALIRQVLQHRVVVSGSAGARAPDWKTMALLFAADRMDHLDATILPALESGKVVVSDRYTLSSLTYQALTAGEAAPHTWLRALNERALAPDLTIVLDVPAEVAAQRRAGRGEASELFEVDALQRQLADAYARAETYLPSQHALIHVDGRKPEDVVFRAVRNPVFKLLEG